MKSIGSSSDYYAIHVRGMDKPIKMSIDGGEKLSSYLTKGETNQFVEIVDINRISRVIRVLTIDRIERVDQKRSRYKTVDELGLPRISQD